MSEEEQQSEKKRCERCGDTGLYLGDEGDTVVCKCLVGKRRMAIDQGWD